MKNDTIKFHLFFRFKIIIMQLATPIPVIFSIAH